jgi:hypothetical protein
MTDIPFFKTWTKRITEKLEEKYKCLSPYIKYKEENFKSNFIVQHDLHLIKNSDFIVFNHCIPNENVKLTGAVIECYEAHKNNIPVYTFKSDDDGVISSQLKSPWMSEFITYDFENEEELVHYLMYNEIKI